MDNVGYLIHCPDHLIPETLLLLRLSYCFPRRSYNFRFRRIGVIFCVPGNFPHPSGSGAPATEGGGSGGTLLEKDGVREY